MREDRPHTFHQYFVLPFRFGYSLERGEILCRRLDPLMRAPGVIDGLVLEVGAERILVKNGQVVEIEITIVIEISYIDEMWCRICPLSNNSLQ